MDENTPVYTSTPAVAKNTRNPYAIPVAIFLGFALIAAAIYFSGSNRVAPTPAAVITNEDQPAQPTTGKIRPVDATDHIKGNPNAPIVIVEYSDYDCPFCKNFHETMNQVMENYGASGKVAWVYRHLPIEQLHPSAPRIAAASECVAELAGNDAFWKFSDLVFGEREINEPTNLSRLTEFATSAGADPAEFNACLESGRTASNVAEDEADAALAGAEGTPFSLVIVGEKQGVINGAQPYSVVSQIIETLLTQLQGSPDVSL
jgi:protein-disulfide isomerase